MGPPTCNRQVAQLAVIAHFVIFHKLNTILLIALGEDAYVVGKRRLAIKRLQNWTYYIRVPYLYCLLETSGLPQLYVLHPQSHDTRCGMNQRVVKWAFFSNLYTLQMGGYWDYAHCRPINVSQSSILG